MYLERCLRMPVFAELCPFPFFSQVLAGVPWGFWRLNEPAGTTATDCSGNGRHGTYSAPAMVAVDSVAGSAAVLGTVTPKLDASGYITLPAMGAIEPLFNVTPSAPGFTIEMLIKPAVQTSDATLFVAAASGAYPETSAFAIVAKQFSGSSYLGFSVTDIYRSEVADYARAQDGTLTGFIAGSRVLLPTSVWSHLLVKVDISTIHAPMRQPVLRFYLNGSYVGISDTSVTQGATLFSGLNYPMTNVARPFVSIGRRGSSGAYNFRGSVSEVAAYSYQVDDATIAARFALGLFNPAWAYATMAPIRAAWIESLRSAYFLPGATVWGAQLDPCGNWAGVTCDTIGKNVVALSVPAGTVAYDALQYAWRGFSLPSALGALKQLTSLSARHCRASSTLPTELSLLTNLVSLDVAYSSLSGTIPSQLSALTRLTYLALGGNWFTGSVPAGFAALTGLKSLQDFAILPNVNLLPTLLHDLAVMSSLTTLDLSTAFGSGVSSSYDPGQGSGPVSSPAVAVVGYRGFEGNVCNNFGVGVGGSTYYSAYSSGTDLVATGITACDANSQCIMFAADSSRYYITLYYSASCSSYAGLYLSGNGDYWNMFVKLGSVSDFVSYGGTSVGVVFYQSGVPPPPPPTNQPPPPPATSFPNQVLPAALGAFSALKMLDLSNCLISGTLPR